MRLGVLRRLERLLEEGREDDKIVGVLVSCCMMLVMNESSLIYARGGCTGEYLFEDCHVRKEPTDAIEPCPAVPSNLTQSTSGETGQPH